MGWAWPGLLGGRCWDMSKQASCWSVLSDEALFVVPFRVERPPLWIEWLRRLGRPHVLYESRIRCARSDVGLLRLDE